MMNHHTYTNYIRCSCGFVGESIDEKRNQLRELLITGLKQNRLNKQSEVKYNIETETIEKITISK